MAIDDVRIGCGNDGIEWFCIFADRAGSVECGAESMIIFLFFST